MGSLPNIAARGAAMSVASDGGAMPVNKFRLDSVDLLRGIVMIVMALDHVRDFLSYLHFPPEDITQTYGALFFTRWITHFCAPTFFFLAGTGAYLSASKGKPISQLSTFLWKRGLWLIVLEWTVCAAAWTFFPIVPWAGVIFALGLSMVCMAAIVRWPMRWIATFGLASILLHNLLDGITVQSFGKLGWVWQMLHQPGFIPVAEFHGKHISFASIYVLIPWVGVMAAGFAFGQVLRKDTAERRRWLYIIGISATALFFVLRLTNLYGNPPSWNAMLPWAAGPFVQQATFGRTLIAFFNVTKYPPSLQFLTMTLGPAILLLAWFDRFDFKSVAGKFGQRLLVFGRVPLFYYVLHLFAIHIYAVLAAIAFGQPWKQVAFGGWMLSELPPGYGHGLVFIYASWLFIVVLLYFPCRWFAALKRRRHEWWLSYM